MIKSQIDANVKYALKQNLPNHLLVNVMNHVHQDHMNMCMLISLESYLQDMEIKITL